MVRGPDLCRIVTVSIQLWQKVKALDCLHGRWLVAAVPTGIRRAGDGQLLLILLETSDQFWRAPGQPKTGSSLIDTLRQVSAEGPFSLPEVHMPYVS